MYIIIASIIFFILFTFSVLSLFVKRIGDVITSVFDGTTLGDIYDDLWDVDSKPEDNSDALGWTMCIIIAQIMLVGISALIAIMFPLTIFVLIGFIVIKLKHKV